MESLFSIVHQMDRQNRGGGWGQRGAAELCYAHRVSLQAQGKWEELLREAAIFFRGGEPTEERCRRMEERLAPMAADCKAYTLLLCSHSHIDLNFQWGYDETVSIVLATFRTMLTLLEEYPDFIYSQSQAAAYEIAAKYEPSLIDGIRKYVREGRWEATAGFWVESDKNMPSGESLAHQAMAAKAYLSGLLGLSPEEIRVGFEPDTFGHNANLPALLQAAGLDYYYFCRGEGNEKNLFNWEAPGGSRVLAYKEPHWYDSRIQPDMAYTVPELCVNNGTDQMMKVYGVGDHGGGPTRRDLERALDMMEWPIFPTLRFGRYHDYFAEQARRRDRFPTVRGELQKIFTGCLTSQSEIKRMNRRCEQMLSQAETLAAFAGGGDAALLDEAWKKTLFNQFHDILPGSCVPQVKYFALGRGQEALAAANACRAHALLRIAERIDTSAFTPDETDRDGLYSWGAGAGIFVQDTLRAGLPDQGRGKRRVFHLFNTTAYDREDPAEVLLWDWYGDTDALTLRDSAGNSVPWQLVNKGFKEEWGHFFLRLLVCCRVPAFGYTTLELSEREDCQLEDTDRMAEDLLLVAENLPPEEEYEDLVLENERVRFVFSHRDLTVKEMACKATGECFRGELGLFELIEEDPETGGSAWVIGRELSRTPLRRFRVTGVEAGPELVRQSVTFEGEFWHSSLRVRAFLDRGSDQLQYEVHCDWHEYVSGSASTGGAASVRQLACRFRPGVPVERFAFDLPYGTVERAPRNMDVCGSSFALAENPAGRGMAVMSDCKYGYRCWEDSIRLTLLRGTSGPDRCPEQGGHDMRFAVGFAADAEEALRQSALYCSPVIDLSGVPGKSGALPPEHRFLRLEAPGAVVSAVKPSETGEADLVLRLYAVGAVPAHAKLTLPGKVESAWLTDLHERKRLGEAEAEGDRVELEIGPSRVVTVAVKLS